MKTSLLGLLIVLTICCSKSVLSQFFNYNETHIVGKQPMTIFYDPNSGIHIICGGWDNNYDGIFDSDDSDELPSWWKFKGFKMFTGFLPPPDDLIKVRDFEFETMDFPFRPGVRPGINQQDSSGILYIIKNGRVKSFALNNGELINDTVVNVSARAIYVDKDELFLSVRNQDSDDQVIIYNMREEKFTDTLAAGVNVQQVIKFVFMEREFLAVLNEGDWGTENSTLQIFNINNSIYQLNKTIELGNGGNHITAYGTTLAVTVNGSMKVILFDIPDFTIRRTIPIPSQSGYDGPRESVITDGAIYTTSYESKIFIIDPSTGEITSDLKSDGKAEGIMAYGQQAIIIANPFVTGTYEPDSTVTVWENILSVDSENVIKELNIYPNPVKEVLSLIVNFENSAGMNFKFQISDLNGRIIFEQNFVPDSDEFQIELDISNVGMAPGSYYAIVKNEKFLRAVPFTKIK